MSLKDKRLHNENEINEYSIDNRLVVNFKTMNIDIPEKGKLKRTWEPGLSAQYRTSRNMSSIKCSVYNLQVRENQYFNLKNI
jgi:hypothetical protein